MTERRVTTKAEMLADIASNWAALNAALDRLTEAQMTTIRDPQGWSVKDHLVHLTAWERSVTFLLQGKARHLGLGVAERLYLTDDDDAINTAIQTRQRELPLSQALHQLREGHAQLMTLIEPLTEAELHRRARHFYPNERGDDDGPMVFNLIYGNTAHHFGEHLGWIESLVNS
jgi:hypothetical protein